MDKLNNILTITDNWKQYGIQRIERFGSLKSGFVIEFTINGTVLRIPSSLKIEASFSRVKKALTNFNYNNDLYTPSDLQNIIESIFIQNLAWSIGEDLKNAAEGIDANEELGPEPEEFNTDDLDPNTYQDLSIKDAIRSHNGKIKVTGIIASVETETHQLIKEIKWICHNCRYPTKRKVYDILEIPEKPKDCGFCGHRVGFENNKHDFVNARVLKIQSADNENNETLETLPVLVLDRHTIDIQVNSSVTVYGKLAKKQDPKTKEYYTVVIAKLVDYESQKELVISNKDELDIINYGKQPDLETKLIEQIAPHVVGEEFTKLASLLIAIGAPEHLENDGSMKKRGRGRIHSLFIGPPGSGKTVLAKAGLLLRLNSKYVSGKNTTAGSLTSMILSEDGKLTLRLGVAATANDAILVINEFDKLSAKDQEAILEVMEEGESILNKYAFLRKIRAKASVIATANPENGRWINDLVVDAKELPFSLALLSRFDIVVIFRKNRTREEVQAFVDGKTEYESNGENYSSEFIQKYIEYARRIPHVIVEPEAAKLLNEYHINLQLDPDLVYDVSNRTWDVIYRTAKTFARLYLTDIVTVEIAERAIDFIKEMLAKLNLMNENLSDDMTYCYDRIIEHLKNHTSNSKNAIPYIDLIKKLCDIDERIYNYLGNIFAQRTNWRVRELWNKVKINLNVIKGSKKPLRLYWLHEDGCQCVLCDACDECDEANPNSDDINNFSKEDDKDKDNYNKDNQSSLDKKQNYEH